MSYTDRATLTTYGVFQTRVQMAVAEIAAGFGLGTQTIPANTAVSLNQCGALTRAIITDPEHYMQAFTNAAVNHPVVAAIIDGAEPSNQSVNGYDSLISDAQIAAAVLPNFTELAAGFPV